MRKSVAKMERLYHHFKSTAYYNGLKTINEVKMKFEISEANYLDSVTGRPITQRELTGAARRFIYC